jgi:hypothetical protein
MRNENYFWLLYKWIISGINGMIEPFYPYRGGIIKMSLE